MRVLIACEFSGVVREAFRSRGADAWSCDLLLSEIPGPHFKCDIHEVFEREPHIVWDLMIAFPPCTHLASSGARWFAGKQREQQEAITFIRYLLERPVTSIAIENPIGVLSTYIRKPDQIIHPWQFGHPEVKATCLWLKNLPKLEPMHVVKGRYPRVHREAPGPNRWKRRSRTYQGIADAMAQQWMKGLP